MRKTKQCFLNSNPRISERQVLSELLVPNPLLAKSVKSMSNETFEPIDNLNDDLRPEYHFKSNDARVRFDRGSVGRSIARPSFEDYPASTNPSTSLHLQQTDLESVRIPLPK